MVSNGVESPPRTAALTAAARRRTPPALPAALLRNGPLSVEAVPAHLLQEEHLQAWDRLYYAQPAPSNPFLSPSWVLGWYQHFVELENRLVLVVRQDRGGGQQSDVVAIAPMHRYRPVLEPLPIARRLLAVRSGLGQNAYQVPGLLCRDGEATQVARTLVAACAELPVDWSGLTLAPEQGWLANRWPGASDRAVTFVDFARPRTCVVLTTLPDVGRGGRASTFELYLGGQHVASQLALHASGTSYVHSSEFRVDTCSLGPTTHLQAELVRHAIGRRDAVANFSPEPNVSKTRWSEELWITDEFSSGAGPRSLAPRFAAFQLLSSDRAALGGAAGRRSQLGAPSALTNQADSKRSDLPACSAAA